MGRRLSTRHSLALWLIYALVVLKTWGYVENLPIHEQGTSNISKYICDMNGSTRTGSTQRDVVLLFATRYAAGLELCLRSLRSAGADCRIVLFVAPSFSFSDRFSAMSDALKIEIVKDCIVTKNRSYVPHMLRFEYELKWLKANTGKIDRIFHTDSFDVFFQGDPFANHVASDSLRFVVEPHQIRSCGWNLAWVRECYGDAVMSRMRHRFIICSGSIAGGVKPYVKLLMLMIAQKEWKKCWEPSMDQPILNYLVWNGQVEKAGIKYHLTGCDGGFFTVQWCVVARKEKMNAHGQIVSEMNTVPSYIHQYNRLQRLSNTLYDRCRMTRQKAT